MTMDLADTLNFHRVFPRFRGGGGGGDLVYKSGLRICCALEIPFIEPPNVFFDMEAVQKILLLYWLFYEVFCSLDLFSIGVQK